MVENLCATNNNTRHMLLRRKITNLRMEEGSSISTFLKNARTFESTCWVWREDPPDKEVVEHMMSTLLESYELMVSSITHRNNMATFLNLIFLFSMRISGVRCASQNKREESSWCKLHPNESNHNRADFWVARTTVGCQLERLGCTISCA